MNIIKSILDNVNFEEMIILILAFLSRVLYFISQNATKLKSQKIDNVHLNNLFLALQQIPLQKDKHFLGIESYNIGIKGLIVHTKNTLLIDCFGLLGAQP